MLKPPKLNKGDTIGIVSPSSPIAALCPNRFKRGVKNLEDLGFDVLVGKHATAHYTHTAGTIEQRLEDLHFMFGNKDVKAIITSIGGFNSNQLLEELDFDLIKKNPKIFMGYSDITALHLGIFSQTGLTTFLGPQIMVQFAECDGLHEYSKQWFERILTDTSSPLELNPSYTSISERLEWDQEDTRARKRNPHEGPKVFKQGKAEGPIISGNLQTMRGIVGTKYFPDMTGAILCIEECEPDTPSSVDRSMTQFRLMGIFDKIAALVVGRSEPNVGFTNEDSFEEIILRTTENYDFPIAIDFDFGHTDPMFILPNGIKASVCFEDKAKLSLLESAVE